MTHDSQVEAVMALVFDYGRKRVDVDRSNSARNNAACNAAIEAIRTALSALAAGKVEAIPEGWKLVPMEPTREMVVAGVKAGIAHSNEPYYIYPAMLAASSSPLSADPESAVVGAAHPDTVLLDFIASEYLEVSAFAMPTGAGDADVGWKLVQEHEGRKGRVEVACHYRDDLRAAIREAMQALGYPTLPHPALDRANAGERESEGAPGATDAERAEWLADKIGACGDYAKEAAQMLRRWPAALPAADPERREGAEGVLVGASVSSPFNKLNGNADGVPAATPLGVSPLNPMVSARAAGVPIPHTFAPPDADTDDSMEGWKK